MLSVGKGLTVSEASVSDDSLSEFSNPEYTDDLGEENGDEQVEDELAATEMSTFTGTLGTAHNISEAIKLLRVSISFSPTITSL